MSITWEAFTNRSEAVPYTVFDGSSALGTVVIDQRDPPADFAEDGVLWQDIGTYQITGSAVTVQLTDDSGRAGSLRGCRCHAYRASRVARRLRRRVEVNVGGADVADGTGIVDFGSTLVGTPVSQVMTVGNVGSLDLVLDNAINPPVRI